jgi:hypothetical protein
MLIVGISMMLPLMEESSTLYMSYRGACDDIYETFSDYPKTSSKYNGTSLMLVAHIPHLFSFPLRHRE